MSKKCGNNSSNESKTSATSGKSTGTDTVQRILGDRTINYSSLTLAGLRHVMKNLTEFSGHIIIDDMGGEKSLWSRISTITVLANLVYGHHVHKITHTGQIRIDNFFGSAALNIQPVMMQSLVQSDEWVAVVRDKTIRNYHLIRPIDPIKGLPELNIEWGEPLRDVKAPRMTGKYWFQLVAVGLTQWSYGRIKEHIPQLLKACVALDGRHTVTTSDYTLLHKLLKPMQLERYLLQSYGFETGRLFLNNTMCILVELASHGNPTIETICEDYKCSPSTVERLIYESKEWAWIKKGSPNRVMSTTETEKILELVGAKEKW